MDANSNDPRLSDGSILLRPLRAEDAADHLAGEDDEIAKWLSGGRSTLATVRTFIESCRESWRIGSPRRAFGVFDCPTNRLIGFVEANFAVLLEPGQVNVSYSVFPQWRRKGIALRALDLIDVYLRSTTNARQIVLRIAPANTASMKLAERAGFTFLGLIDEPEGLLARYVRDVK
jgi:RimJ/RimL family protein N-acetyltransferase